MDGRKIIHDSVHGGIIVDEPFLSFLHRPEMQRLHNVRQLGLAYLVFPGANHTRFEHSLGVFHIARMMGEALEIEEHESRELKAAALLHDICHSPFSHTLEDIVRETSGMDHMQLASSIIRGEPLVNENSPFSSEHSIAEDLEKEDIDPDTVASIVSEPIRLDPQQSLLLDLGRQTYFGAKQYLNQVIHGPVDADQIDYLLRDAHYTGVAHGIIDMDRIMNTIAVHNGSLVVKKGGAAAVEGMMVARALMYSSIYFHKTVRIAEMMLAKAVECASPSTLEGLYAKTEAELCNQLLHQDGAPRKLITRILRRELYKSAVYISSSDIDDNIMESLLALTDYHKRIETEKEVADRAGIRREEVLIDIPSRTSLLFMARVGKTDIPILEDGKIRPISKYSPLAKALQNRSIHDWSLIVSCPPESREKVARAVEKVVLG
ncbi:MAG: uncharacterized protein PWQ88_44 [Candidatus Methanomethylophilaceae archaeon]|nr:uncharacterized protein [Candidatus Methanomethylophilaceae archaeon]MDI3541815.1 uncharacterized protein [Candidatus Methanomethylophilaceae archaeon]